MISTGIIPKNFNDSYITPIPKEKEIANKPSTFRPISVSSSLANMSGYLFKCIDLDIGCKIGNLNVSIIAYCDDLYLLAEKIDQMEN